MKCKTCGKESGNYSNCPEHDLSNTGVPYSRDCKEATPVVAPIPMILYCPKCSFRHIDEGEWATRPHHTHRCNECDMEWTPALVHTYGVLKLIANPGAVDAARKFFDHIEIDTCTLYNRMGSLGGPERVVAHVKDSFGKSWIITADEFGK